MTTTVSAGNGAARPQRAGIYAGAVTEPQTPITDRARDYLNLDSLFTADDLANPDEQAGQ